MLLFWGSLGYITDTMQNPRLELDAFLERMRREQGQQIDQLPLPEGVDGYVYDLVADGRSEDVLFLLKLSWLLGAQAGYVAAIEQSNASSTGSVATTPTGRVKA